MILEQLQINHGVEENITTMLETGYRLSYIQISNLPDWVGAVGKITFKYGISRASIYRAKTQTESSSCEPCYPLAYPDK